MLDMNTVENYHTEHHGTVHSVLIGFRPAMRATKAWKFTHAIDGTLLRIFADRDGMPIAIEFSRFPDELPTVTHESRESFEIAVRKLHAFAVQMIDYGQLSLPAPTPRLFNQATRRARRIESGLPPSATPATACAL